MDDLVEMKERLLHSKESGYGDMIDDIYEKNQKD